MVRVEPLAARASAWWPRAVPRYARGCHRCAGKSVANAALGAIATEQRIRQRSRFGHGEPSEPNLLGKPLRQQSTSQFAHRRACIKLVTAVGPDDEHRARSEASGEPADNLQAQLVSPMQIVEDDEELALVVKLTECFG